MIEEINMGYKRRPGIIEAEWCKIWTRGLAQLLFYLFIHLSDP